MTEAMIRIRNASFSYGGPQIFDGIDMDVYPGRVLCLMGVNGCGKSTLIDCILGVNEGATGEIFIDDRQVAEMKPVEIARKLAFVPQVHNRSFPYLVKDIVLMGRTAHHSGLASPNEEDRALCRQAMKLCRIDHLADRPYTQISGGEMQMVMLTRALVQDAPVIIMDEPTAHLDFRNELLFLETVVDLVKERNIGVLLATHSPNQAFYFENSGVPTEVALMADGGIRQTGRPSQVLTEDALRQVYHMDVRVANVDLDRDGIYRQIIPVRTRSREE